MSLTRDEWIEMWDEVKFIEGRIKFLHRIGVAMHTGHRILKSTDKIKQQIQSVIGQME